MASTLLPPRNLLAFPGLVALPRTQCVNYGW